MSDVRRAAVGSIKGDSLRAKRDRALLLLGFAMAARCSELTGLDVEGLQFSERGLYVTIKRSKTDQEGNRHEDSWYNRHNYLRSRVLIFCDNSTCDNSTAQCL